MKRRAAVVLLAVSAAGAVLLWPAWPAWSVRSAGKVVGFTADGGLLMRTESADTGVRVVQHVAATGRVEADAVLAGADTLAAVAPNGRTAVAWCIRPRGYLPAPATDGWAVFDTATGTRLTPITPGFRFALTLYFSRRGRWLVRYPIQSSDQWWDVRDAATGRPALTVEPTATERCVSLAFRDDDTAVAAVWIPHDETRPAARVELRELPGGRVLRQFPIPAAGYYRVADWRENRLLVYTQAGVNMAGTYREYDTAGESVGRVVERFDPAGDWGCTNLEAVGGHVQTQSRPTAERLPDSWLAWGAARGWWRYAAPDTTDVRFRLLDPITGAVRVGPTRWVRREPFGSWDGLSADGRWVWEVVAGTVAVWPARPWPRGPVALVAAGAMLLLDRRPRPAARDPG